MQENSAEPEACLHLLCVSIDKPPPQLSSFEGCLIGVRGVCVQVVERRDSHGQRLQQGAEAIALKGCRVTFKIGQIMKNILHV